MIPGPRPPAPPLPEADEVIAGKYRIVRPIGFGGMGMVFEATHIRLRQRVAIKMLHPEKMGDEDLARFDREGRAAVQLRGVNVARVLDVDTLPNGTPYMVMEYLVGNDLSDEVDRHGQLPVEVAADIVKQAADAMSEAHALGIVHRDLKPSNLFLCDIGGPRRLVKVLDFGISKVDEGDGRVTKTEGALGTALYMSPEQARAPRSVDGRTDVWSLGVILFELLSGRPPFEGTMTAVVSALAADPVPSPLTFRADLPPALVELVMKALTKDREKRFQSAAELATALAPFAPAEPIAALAALAMTAPRAPSRSGVDWSEPTAKRGDPNADTLALPTPTPLAPSPAAAPPAPIAPPAPMTPPAPIAPSSPTDASSPEATRPRRSRWLVVALLVAFPAFAFALRLATRDVTPAPPTPSSSAAAPSALVGPTASSALPTTPLASTSATSGGASAEPHATALSTPAPFPLPRPPRPPPKPSAAPSASAASPPSASAPPPPPKNPVHI